MDRQILKRIQNLLAWSIVALLVPIGLAVVTKNFYRGLEFLLLALVVCPETPITSDWLRLVLTIVGCGICRLF